MKQQTLPTLYKVTSKGAIQQWDMRISELEDGTAEYTATYGQIDGAMQVATVKVSKGKNIGRANETTPYEQAFSEAGSKWNKQKDKGYTEDVPSSTDTSGTKKPMLAHDYGKYKHKVVFPAFIQPKLDGVRCIAYLDGTDIVMLSRLGKQHNLPHLKEALAPIFEAHPDLVLDGELYIHGQTFQTIISLIKRLQDETKKIQFHVYDTIAAEGFAERFKNVLGNPLLWESGTLVPVDTKPVSSHEEVAEGHATFTSIGYEGAILRSGTCTYKEGYRSHELLKVKEWQDGEFEITNAKRGVGKCENQCIFTCKTLTGAEFDVKCMGTDEEREQQWIDREKYFGKMLTVKYFEWTTGDNPVPRFPIGIAVREGYE